MYNINWYEIEYNSQKSMMIEVCKYWKEHNNINNEKLSTTYVGNIFNISRITVLRYIKIGNEIGLCDYKKRNKILKTNDNYVEIYKNNTKIGDFNTYKDIINYLKEENLNYSKISYACKTNKPYKGFIFIIKNKRIKEGDIYG